MWNREKYQALNLHEFITHAPGAAQTNSKLYRFELWRYGFWIFRGKVNFNMNINYAFRSLWREEDLRKKR